MARHRIADPMFDTRHRCPHCNVRTWMTDYRAFMADHDRPDGRRCQAAARSVSPLSDNTERKSDHA